MIRSDPPSHQPIAESELPFCVAEDSNVICFHWLNYTRGDNCQSFLMFVHGGAFLDIELPPSHDPTPKTIEWEVWGPKNTRIFANSEISDDSEVASEYMAFAGETYGGRFVVYPVVSKAIQLLDFTKHASAAWITTTEAISPSAIDKHHPTASSNATTSSYIVPRSLPTIVPSNCFVGGSVTTSLPYCVASRPFDPAGRVNDVCLGEGGIVFRLVGSCVA